MENKFEDIDSTSLIENLYETLLSSDEEVAPIVLETISSLVKLYPQLAVKVLDSGEVHLVAIFDSFELNSRIRRSTMKLLESLSRSPLVFKRLYEAFEGYLGQVLEDGMKNNSQEDEKSQNKATQCFTVY